MNGIFVLFSLLSILLLCKVNPESVLSAMISGANKGILLTFSLASLYSVWMGVFALMGKIKVTEWLSKILHKPIKFLFGKISKESEKAVTMNISANILGLGGIATPMGIEGCYQLEKEGKEDKSELLLILASTSLQLLPTSTLALAVKNGSKNPSSLILPTIICTLFSSILGVILYKVFEKLQRNFRIRKKKIFFKRRFYKRGKNLRSEKR